MNNNFSKGENGHCTLFRVGEMLLKLLVASLKYNILFGDNDLLGNVISRTYDCWVFTVMFFCLLKHLGIFYFLVC